MKKIFSLDLEVNGLYGVGFAAAATVRKDGIEMARFEGRIPDSAVTEKWVIENVLPALVGMPVTHNTSVELEEALWAFYAEHCLVQGQWGPSFDGDNVEVIAHCGSPVESGFFRRAVERDGSRTFQGPLPLQEVGTLLSFFDEKASSVDAYVKKFDLAVPFDGVAHHPTYDAVVAAVVWEHLMARKG